jgi:AraC-like DNA-binding protein
MGSLLIRPSAALQLFVEKLLIFEGEKCDIGQPMRVLPRPNVVLGFQYGELVQAAQPNGNTDFFENGLTGVQTLPRSVSTTEKSGFILVYFTPGGASAFLPCSMTELTDHHADLGLFLPRQEVHETFCRVYEAATRWEKASMVQKFLLHQLRKEKVDRLVLWAVSRLQGTGGNIPIRNLAKEASISQRQLERRFQTHVGVSPKQFGMLCRFRQCLETGQAGWKTVEIAHGTGFYDQAHFTRQFKQKTGSPPKIYFSNLRSAEIL